MFGRKKPTPEPMRFAPQPRPAQTDADDGVDKAIAIMSQAIGVDLDFGSATIFAPSLWHDPDIGPMLEEIGLKPNMRGNMLGLLKSPTSVAKLSAMDPETPLRTALAESRIGVALYDPAAENGYHNGLIEMQRKQLREFATRPDYTERARHYATIDLLRFSEQIMLGKVKLG